MVGHTTLFLLVLASSTQAENCLHPPPSESFSNQLYAGRWFEVILKAIETLYSTITFQVGKYQTLGGSIFQIGTVCTEANFIPYGEVGDGDIGERSYFQSVSSSLLKTQAIQAEETLLMENMSTPQGL